jgi:predicted GNAT family N-acyltransferase
MKPTFKTVPHSSSDWRAAVNLREEVLRKPLGEQFTAEELEAEKNHIHIIGLINEELVATAVLVPEESKLKMQRVAVSDQYRNLEIGSQMMKFCESYATSIGVNILYCHARDSAVNFYLKNGYNSVGDYFDEDGIPHLKMYKSF